MKGLANVFAAGDITATDEEKTAYHADLQGMVAAHNILRLERGQGLQSYPRGEPCPASPATRPHCLCLRCLLRLKNA